jgi:2-polyprenyl-6-methoxyphenol hydroxylase-like FAD-dependent oxidoreductase
MLAIGLPAPAACFYRGERRFATISFAGIHPRYPFMLALSQATTEHLLTQALEAEGGHVERGVKMVACRNVADQAEATLEPTAGGPREVARCPWLLAADGTHSVARQQLGIDFVGSSLAQEWYLADVPLRTALAEDRAHAFFLAEGAFLFLIRVVDEALKDRPGEPIWRIITNRPEPLSHLILAEQAGLPLWASGFHIAHRINATLAAGHVYFAGDAGHIHSPLGARGMNLGLEDAWVFAELVRADRLSQYNQLRRPVDQRVVRQVKLLSQVASSATQFDRLVRTYVFPLVLKLPFLRARMVPTVTGLDHPLPHIAGTGLSGSQTVAVGNQGEA